MYWSVNRSEIDCPGDPLIKFIPDYPNKKFASSATIKDLLGHTSGIVDFWDGTFEKEWDHISSHGEVLPFIEKMEIKFDPGTQRFYSNSGYVLLGLIIEHITHQTYYDYVNENIFKKLKMVNTGFFQDNGQDSLIAINYEGLTNKWSEAPHGLRGNAAYGAFSTLDDMLKFHTGLKEGKILSKKTLELLQTDITPEGSIEKWNYGLGFIDEKINGQRVLGHGGISYGIYFKYRYYPAKGYVSIFFSNSESGQPDILEKQIMNFITDDDWHPALTNEISEKETFTIELIEKEEEIFNAADLKESILYWTIIDEIVSALNQMNEGVINSKFEKPDQVTRASNESMYKFFVDKVIPIRGKIKSFHALSEAVITQDSRFPLRTGTFHFEDGFPGSITIAIDENGYLDHLSLFVHRQICPNGITKDCNLVIRD